MNKKMLYAIVFMLLGGYAIAQKSINNYKYIIVPLEYDFLKEKDQYRLNTLTRYLFKQEGFTVFFDEEEFPEDLKNDKCKALYANVKKAKGSFLATKLELLLKDCFGSELFKSAVGSSREKDFKTSYSEALREAFVSIEALDYNYEPAETDVLKNTVDNKIEVKDTKVKVEQVEVNTEVAEIKKTIEKIEEVNEDLVLYAQEKKYGYQLVDATPKVVMLLLKTSAKNVFLVKDKNAIVFKEDGFWYYSENNGELKERTSITIKF